ncbi:MAG: PAS domain S-box protein [Chloroflexi bacterium]|nr:PAS domain S-box protein [Chloroflexota bacterium]
MIEKEFDFLDHIPMGMFVLQEDFTVLFWNSCIEDWTRISRSQLIGKDIGTLFPHLREPRYTGRLGSIFEGGPPVIFSSQLHKYVIPAPLRDGQLRVQHTTVTPVPAPDGAAFYALFAIQDITELTHRIREYRAMRDQALEETKERRQAEVALQKQTHALRESERRFHTLAKMSPVGIFRTDAEGRYLYVNEHWCEITGLVLEDVQGKVCWAQGVHPDDSERVAEEWRQVARESLAVKSEYRFQRPDGVVNWVFGQTVIEKGVSGEITSYVGTITDITERKWAEDALRESEARYKTLFDNAGDAIFIYDLEGYFLGVNQVACNRLRYSREELLQMTAMDIGSPEYTTLMPERLEQLRQRGQTFYETVHMRQDGTFVPVELNSRIIEYRGIPAVLSVARDITERKRAQEALYKAHDELETRVQERTRELALANKALRAEIDVRERAEVELEQRAAQLVLLNDIGGKIAAVMDLDSVLDRAARLVQESFGYHHVALFTVDREQDELVMRTRAGSFVSLFPPEHRLKLGQGMVGWAGLHGEKMLTNDVNADPHYVNLYPGVVPTQSELSVPIRVGEEIVGVLDVQSPQTDAFDEGDVRMMETLADQIAIAIENARLYDAVQRELTERKRAEETLREYAFIANASKEFMTLVDQDHTYQAANDSYCQAHNRPREEIIGKTVADVWGQEKYDTQIMEHMNECFAGNETNYQVWFTFAALGLRCLDVTYYPYYDDKGTVTHIVIVSRDITESKHAADALQKAHAQNQQLLVSISSILIGVSSSDQITHWNTSAEAAFNMPVADTIGKPFLECGIQWDWAEITNHIADCRNENRPTHLNDIRYTRLDGKDGFLDITLNPVVGDDPAQPGFLLLGEEISNRKVLEMQLAQAQKLEAIGQLAAGIAHEINTPIQYVGHNARFVQEAFASISNILDKYHCLLDAVQSGSVSEKLVIEVQNTVNQVDTAFLSREIASAARQSLEGIDRVAEIVRAMRGFSHPGVGGKALTDINDTIKGAVTVTRNEWKHIAQVEMDFDFSLPLVPCIPGEFSQVVVNVIINAVHAISDVVSKEPNTKGTISICTRQDGDWVEIRISDTGAGIPEEVQSKVFDPFFTTKDVGKGTGQGLSIAHNVIVEKHKGMITLESDVGKGTTFMIRLPIKEPKLVQ